MITSNVETIYQWCDQQSIRYSESGLLHFSGSDSKCLQFRAPKDAKAVLHAARAIALIGTDEEPQFEGGVLWIRDWDSMNATTDRIGWSVIESIRRAAGEQRSLEASPAHWFRSDELATFVASIMCCILFDWDAFATTFTTLNFFVHMREAYIVTAAADSLTAGKLSSHFERFSLLLEEPPPERRARYCKTV